MILQGTVGPSLNQDGANPSSRQGKTGEFNVADAHGRYYEPAYRGNLFYASNVSAQALSVASSTYTGLILQNPVNNNKNLVLHEVIFACSIVQTGVGAVVLGWGTAQTAGVPLALTTGSASGATGLSTTLGGAAKSSAQVGASCTFSVLGAAAAPTIIRPLLGLQWITAVSQPMFYTKDEIAGGIIIAPGYNFCIEAVTTATTGFSYFSWEEVPV